MIGMSWDNVIDKEVKSADKQDLGKVESITKHYVEVKQGTISKKHYFIPKYYIQGYDGHKLWASLTKDEIKHKYERDSPPLESEIETSEYVEHKQKMIPNTLNSYTAFLGWPKNLEYLYRHLLHTSPYT